jgi:hypothetical protein
MKNKSGKRKYFVSFCIFHPFEFQALTFLLVHFSKLTSIKNAKGFSAMKIGMDFC